MSHTHLINQKEALKFILAGCATFTAKSVKTNKHFTYKVVVPKDKDKDASDFYFVSVLTGSNNDSDYSYLGMIKLVGNKPTFSVSKKSKIGPDAPSAQALNYIVNNLLAHEKTNNTKLELWHEGRCCRCGRKLTTPESVENGIGPECASIKGGKAQASRVA